MIFNPKVSFDNFFFDIFCFQGFTILKSTQFDIVSDLTKQFVCGGSRVLATSVLHLSCLTTARKFLLAEIYDTNNYRHNCFSSFLIFISVRLVYCFPTRKVFCFIFLLSHQAQVSCLFRKKN